MKRRTDPRHQARVQAVKTLFAANFKPGLKTKKASLAGQVIACQQDIDAIITKNAPSWPIEQLNPIDLAVLRLAIFELIYKKEQPYKVIIDEAVEIAKTFGSNSSGSFVNGVLGTIVKSQQSKSRIENQNETTTLHFSL